MHTLKPNPNPSKTKEKHSSKRSGITLSRWDPKCSHTHLIVYVSLAGWSNILCASSFVCLWNCSNVVRLSMWIGCLLSLKYCEICNSASSIVLFHTLRFVTTKYYYSISAINKNTLHSNIHTFYSRTGNSPEMELQQEVVINNINAWSDPIIIIIWLLFNWLKGPVNWISWNLKWTWYLHVSCQGAPVSF